MLQSLGDNGPSLARSEGTSAARPGTRVVTET